MNRAIAFYCDHLGLKVKFRDTDAWVTLDVVGTTLALESGLAERPPGPIQVSLKVMQDFDSFVDRLRRKGVTMGEMTMGTHERTVKVFDPDGNPTTLYAALRT
jgi:catechol 2,3-dioxygenase-like lactoylglutathione lyase family enzyme